MSGVEESGFHPVLMEAALLLREKSEDYNNDPNPDPARRNYFPFGDASYLHMLHTKFERVKAIRLAKKENPNFEGARDSLIDLINYAAFYAAYLDQESLAKAEAQVKEKFNDKD